MKRIGDAASNVAILAIVVAIVLAIALLAIASKVWRRLTETEQ